MAADGEKPRKAQVHIKLPTDQAIRRLEIIAAGDGDNDLADVVRNQRLLAEVLLAISETSSAFAEAIAKVGNGFLSDG